MVVVVLLMLDLLGTDEGRVGLVGYFRGIPIVVPRAILDDELPIILFFLLFFLIFFSFLVDCYCYCLLLHINGLRWFPLCIYNLVFNRATVPPKKKKNKKNST